MKHPLIDCLSNLQLDPGFVEDVRTFLAAFVAIMDTGNSFPQDFIYGSNRAPLKSLEAVLGSGVLGQAIDRGIVVADAETGYLPVGFIKIDANTYLRESKWFYEHRNLFSFTPAHVNDFVKRQIGYLKLLVGKRKLGRLLEMGCGTGMVTLELADHFDECLGADIYPRSLSFAQANLQLSGRKNVAFVHSDLFANAEGKHDLIVFYPWAPAEDSLPLVARFLDQAPDALAPEGTIVLITGSDSHSGDQMVFDTVTKACVSHDLRGSREFMVSYRMAQNPRSIGTISAFVLRRDGRSPSHAGLSPVRTVMNKGYAAFLARRTMAAFLHNKR